MKACTKCRELKRRSDFNSDARRPGKLMARCKNCHNLEGAKWRKDNPDKQKACEAAWLAKNPDYDKKQSARWAERNKDRLVAARAAWKKANKTRIKEVGAKYAKENAHRVAAHNAARRARKMRATPLWANQFFIGEAYALASLRTKMLGYAWHVDHIVPLRSKLVCGLHCEANMRVISGNENKSKGNRYWPGMPS